MVREALQGEGEQAQQFRRGRVDGIHYLELVKPIKQLKREGRLAEALVLCYEAAKRDSGGWEPAPCYTEQAAVVHRKLGQRAEEIAVLKMWMHSCPKSRGAGSRIAERLAKLEAA